MVSLHFPEFAKYSLDNFKLDLDEVLPICLEEKHLLEKVRRYESSQKLFNNTSKKETTQKYNNTNSRLKSIIFSEQNQSRWQNLQQKNPLNSGFKKNLEFDFLFKKKLFFSVLFAKILTDWKQINSDVATKLTFSGLLAYMLALPM